MCYVMYKSATGVSLNETTTDKLSRNNPRLQMTKMLRIVLHHHVRMAFTSPGLRSVKKYQFLGGVISLIQANREKTYVEKLL